MTADSNFQDEEIERERRAATSRKKNVDEQRVQLMRDTMQIIQTERWSNWKKSWNC